jgi:hypothetical protein
VKSNAQISSAEAFPANPSVSPASDSPKKTSVGSGQKLTGAFAHYDHDTHCWKTSQVSFLPECQTYSATWPRAGMTRSGTAYQRPQLVPRTSVTESGLWPTPRSAMASMYPEYGEHWNDNRGGESLATAVARWPTPVAGMAERGDRGDLNTAVKGYESTHTRWSTPTVRDAGTLAKCKRGAGSLAKGNEIIEPLVVQVGGTLNPTFVEYLMGFPKGWSEVE